LQLRKGTTQQPPFVFGRERNPLPAVTPFRCRCVSFSASSFVLCFVVRSLDYSIHLSPPMATVTDSNSNNPAPENPNKTLDPTLPDPVLVATEAADDTDTTEAADAKTSPPPESGNDAPLSDIQKKIRRAERFGISVQMSEKEKRNSRAERSVSNFTPRFFKYTFNRPCYYPLLSLCSTIDLDTLLCIKF